MSNFSQAKIQILFDNFINKNINEAKKIYNSVLNLDKNDIKFGEIEFINCLKNKLHKNKFDNNKIEEFHKEKDKVMHIMQKAINSHKKQVILIDNLNFIYALLYLLLGNDSLNADNIVFCYFGYKYKAKQEKTAAYFIDEQGKKFCINQQIVECLLDVDYVIETSPCQASQ